MQILINVKGNTPNSVKTFDIPIGFFSFLNLNLCH